MTDRTSVSDGFPKTFDAILPAGGRLDGAFAQQTGTCIKALLRPDGQTLLRRAILALREVETVRRIVVVGGPEARAEAHEVGADGTVEEGASGPENILRGLDWLQQQSGGVTQRVLTVTTDLPFLTSGSIVEFLDRCPPEVDVALPLVTQAVFEARYPGLSNEFTALREGAFAPGGVMRIDAGTLGRCRPILERLFAARKSPLQMATVIGPAILIRYVTRQLSVQHLIARAQTLVGCSGAPVYEAPPELAYDIDLPEEYAYACRVHADGADTVSKAREMGR